MTLTVPPLRERSADVLPIADMLLGQACQELARPALGFSPEVRASLLAYPWPGNIRELKNEVYRAVALSEGPQVSAAALSCRVLHGQQGASAAAQPGLQIPGSGSLQERLDAIEAAILRETLLRHRWNKTHAAKELGLSRVGLRQSCPLRTGGPGRWLNPFLCAVAAIRRLRRLQHVAAVRRHGRLCRTTAPTGHPFAVAPLAVAGKRERALQVFEDCLEGRTPGTCCASRAQCCAGRAAPGASTCWRARSSP
jgi:hypothetical protein